MLYKTLALCCIYATGRTSGILISW